MTLELIAHALAFNDVTDVTALALLSAMDEKESVDKSVNCIEDKPQALQIQFPVVDSRGKILLPPADLRERSSAPVYANPRQALRILKRREMKRRLALSGRLKIGRQEKKKTTEGKDETDEESAD